MAIKKGQTKVPTLVVRNIAQLVSRQQERTEKLGRFHRFADMVTRVSGSISFLVFHLLWFAIWIACNINIFPQIKTFDPYPFGFLTFIVSLEAIALSVMVLMVQNQIQEDADRRADVDLHVNLLAESETTFILKKLCRIEEKMGIAVDNAEKVFVDELLRDTNPVDIEETIENVT